MVGNEQTEAFAETLFLKDKYHHNVPYTKQKRDKKLSITMKVINKSLKPGEMHERKIN